MGAVNISTPLAVSIPPIEAIVRLAQRVPVFPCRRGLEQIGAKLYKPKSPLTANGLKDATQDADQVRAWWGRWPDALVGVPTGSTTGLIVVDYDSHKADAAAQEFVELHSTDLLATRYHQTVNGGRHYLFKQPGEIKYRSGANVLLGGKARGGIDIRAEGGYIIWWPLHGAEAYQNIVSLPAGLIDERKIEQYELAPLPSATPEAWAKDVKRVADALVYLNPQDYDGWIQAGMAIHFASQGADSGFELWHAWSNGSVTGDLPHNYSGVEDCRYKWDSFGRHQGRPVTLGSLFAAAKAGGWAAQAPTPTAPPMDLPPIDVYQNDLAATHVPDPLPLVPEQDIGPRVQLLRFSAEELMGAITPEKYLLPQIAPTEAYTLLAGSLSAAKTTLLHSMLLWRATGFDALDLSGESSCVDIGPCVLISYEDSDNRIIRRFQRLVQHQYALAKRVFGDRYAREYLANAEKNLRRVTLTGQYGAGIVMRHEGAIVENGRQVDLILKAIGGFATSGVLAGIDPLRLAIVGSQNDDDGADVVVHVLNRIANYFPDSGLIIPSHTTKSQARESGSSMADAAYATSGSALYSQHARSNFHISRLTSEQMRNEFPVGTFTDEEIEKQLATRLVHGRLSHGTESNARVFAMRSGVLEPVKAAIGDRGVMDEATDHLRILSETLSNIQLSGGIPSRHTLESDKGLTRKLGSRVKLRAFIRLALDQDWLTELGTTNTKRITLTAKGRTLADQNGGSIHE